jgi:hypothetical protein
MEKRFKVFSNTTRQLAQEKTTLHIRNLEPAPVVHIFVLEFSDILQPVL